MVRYLDAYMTPLETSCMFSLKRMGMLYGESNDMFLCLKLHYKLIFI